MDIFFFIDNLPHILLFLTLVIIIAILLIERGNLIEISEKQNMLKEKISDIKIPECPKCECPDNPECPKCECPDNPECPKCPEMPECPQIPECPTPDVKVENIVKESPKDKKMPKMSNMSPESPMNNLPVNMSQEQRNFSKDINENIFGKPNVKTEKPTTTPPAQGFVPYAMTSDGMSSYFPLSSLMETVPKNKSEEDKVEEVSEMDETPENAENVETPETPEKPVNSNTK